MTAFSCNLTNCENRKTFLLISVRLWRDQKNIRNGQKSTMALFLNTIHLNEVILPSMKKHVTAIAVMALFAGFVQPVLAQKTTSWQLKSPDEKITVTIT